jgi:hypothetical protein
MSMSDPAAQHGVHGGIVEIDEDGHAVRSASTADRRHADDPLMAYSLLPLPDLDRVLVTNSGMRDVDPTGHTIQLFRLSDLKLVATQALDPGPKEVSRVVLDGKIAPHWTGYDPRTHRIAVSGYGESRVYLLTFDPDKGAVAIDRACHDRAGEPGFDAGPQAWPHGWNGGAQVHGIVFSK